METWNKQPPSLFLLRARLPMQSIFTICLKTWQVKVQWKLNLSNIDICIFSGRCWISEGAWAGPGDQAQLPGLGQAAAQPLAPLPAQQEQVSTAASQVLRRSLGDESLMRKSSLIYPRIMSVWQHWGFVQEAIAISTNTCLIGYFYVAKSISNSAP